MQYNAQNPASTDTPLAFAGKKDAGAQLHPGFYIVSVNGLTYLTAARSRNEAVNLLAESQGVGTDPADWTKMRDEMFSEIVSARLRPGVVMSRARYLDLCNFESRFIDLVEMADETPGVGRAAVHF